MEQNSLTLSILVCREQLVAILEAALEPLFAFPPLLAGVVDILGADVSITGLSRIDGYNSTDDDPTQ